MQFTDRKANPGLPSCPEKHHKLTFGTERDLRSGAILQIRHLQRKKRPMQITELTLATQQLQTQQQFYTTILGLPLNSASSEMFSVQVGSTHLTFQQTTAETLYHIAFAIPTHKAALAKVWLEARVPLLQLDGQDEFTSESWRSTSFYFRDAAGHILELIAHHDQSDNSSGSFGSNDLLHLCEIGMAFENVATQVEDWKTNFGLEVYRDSISEQFAAVGDIDGLFITVQRGRNWFPTSTDAAVIAPVDVTIQGATGTSRDLAPYPYRILVG